MEKKHYSDDELRKILTSEEYKIIREKGTERPFTGEYLNVKDDGTYVCKVCKASLFSSDTKFDSHSGWPSFYDVIEEGNVVLESDDSLGAVRTEVICATCGAHLGHVFSDGPERTGKRYCINSLSLELNKDK